MEDNAYIETTRQRLAVDQRELTELTGQRQELESRISRLRERIQAFEVILGEGGGKAHDLAGLVRRRGSAGRRSTNMPSRRSEYQETTLARAIMAVLTQRPTHVNELAGYIWDLSSPDDLRIAKRSLYAELSRLNSAGTVVKTEPAMYRKP